MALHGQHIKGVYGTTPVYTYIEFAEKADGTVGALPSIYISDTNSANRDAIEKYTNLGKIIASNATGQKIEQPFSFLKYVDMQDGLKIAKSADRSMGLELVSLSETSDSSKFGIVYNEKLKKVIFQLMESNGELGIRDSKKGDIVGFTETSISAKQRIIFGNPSTTEINKDFVKAPYFNATSDIRAKENILPFNGKALDIISKLQTYTYNYKSTKQKSYGIMAQDMLDVDINGFSFVDNVAATGENGDYMSIHESKLVYLLIEGMKEQQKEIQSLRQEVEDLKHGK